MPFTTSHPAAVLPLKHLFPRWFSLTGLMAGAMSPDLLYFLILDTANRGFSHSWTGLFVFCLPAGVTFSFAFHKLLKYHVILNLPKPLDIILSGLAFQRFKITGLRQWIILSGSVLTGALSHFFWDSFTHAHGEIAEAIPFLLEESTIFGITRQNCTFLQHLSTVLGAIIIPAYILKFRLIPGPEIKNPINSAKRKLRFWLTGIAIATFFAIIIIFIKIQYFEWGTLTSYRLAYLAKSFGLAGWAGYFYMVCLYALFSKPEPVQKG
jgi:hypothetical protein